MSGSVPEKNSKLVEEAPEESVVKALLQSTNPVEFVESTPSDDQDSEQPRS